VKPVNEVFLGAGAASEVLSSVEADCLENEARDEPENVKPVFFGAGVVSSVAVAETFVDSGACSFWGAAVAVDSAFLEGSVMVVVEATVATVEGLPDMNAAVAALRAFGFTSFHSASLMSSGFLGP